MDFVRERYTQLCLLAFAVTSGGGVLVTLWPRPLLGILRVPIENTFSARLLGMALVSLGLAYLLALIFEEAKNPLLFIVTSFFCMGTLYELIAFWMCQVNWLALGDAAFGSVFIIFGIMAMRIPKDGAS